MFEKQLNLLTSFCHIWYDLTLSGHVFIDNLIHKKLVGNVCRPCTPLLQLSISLQANATQQELTVSNNIIRSLPLREIQFLAFMKETNHYIYQFNISLQYNINTLQIYHLTMIITPNKTDFMSNGHYLINYIIKS